MGAGPLETARRPPTPVRIVEVGPRDGLQSQPDFIPTATKVEWIRRLAAAGLTEIEATSFVHPRWIPQLADAELVIPALSPSTAARISALVPNRKGLERALALGVREVAVFTAASESFSAKNTHCTIDESFARVHEIFARLAQEPAPVRVRGYLSTCFACPYEGAVDPARVAELTARLLVAGCVEVAISDTIGSATPAEVERVLNHVLRVAPVDRIALHFHDTRGLALANVLTGLLAGVRVFDASAGGMGGCPYAPGAAGNLATEELVALLASLGQAPPSVDLEALIAASLWLERQLGKPLPGRLLASRRPHPGSPVV